MRPRTAGVKPVSADERGLARPVGPDQPDDLAGGDREVHAVERHDAAVGDGQVVHLEQRHVRPTTFAQRVRNSPVRPSGAAMAVTMSATPLMANT